MQEFLSILEVVLRAIAALFALFFVVYSFRPNAKLYLLAPRQEIPAGARPLPRTLARLIAIAFACGLLWVAFGDQLLSRISRPNRFVISVIAMLIFWMLLGLGALYHATTVDPGAETDSIPASPLAQRRARLKFLILALVLLCLTITGFFYFAKFLGA